MFRVRGREMIPKSYDKYDTDCVWEFLDNNEAMYNEKYRLLVSPRKPQAKTIDSLFRDAAQLTGIRLSKVHYPTLRKEFYEEREETLNNLPLLIVPTLYRLKFNIVHNDNTIGYIQRLYKPFSGIWVIRVNGNVIDYKANNSIELAEKIYNDAALIRQILSYGE